MTDKANNLKEAAQRLGCGVSTVYNLIAEDLIQARKLLGKTIVLDSEIERFLSALPRAELQQGGYRTKPRRPARAA